MNDLATLDAYGALTGPDTLTIRRLMPGPVDRIWSYLTESEKRRKWLAAGDMEMRIGAPFELVWRNDELTDPPGERPDGMSSEHSMQSRVTELDPPRRIAFTWGETGEVAITLEPQGEKVLLTLVHRRLPAAPVRYAIGAGWHAHLDLLATLAAGERPTAFWDGWRRLRQDYVARMTG